MHPYLLSDICRDKKENCYIVSTTVRNEKCEGNTLIMVYNHTSEVATVIAASVGNLRVGSELCPTCFFVIPVWGEGQHSAKNNWSDEDTWLPKILSQPWDCQRMLQSPLPDQRHDLNPIPCYARVQLVFSFPLTSNIVEVGYQGSVASVWLASLWGQQSWHWWRCLHSWTVPLLWHGFHKAECRYIAEIMDFLTT